MNKHSELIEKRKFLANTFPESGSVRAAQAAAFLGIGLSTFWRYASPKDGRIKKPTKLGARVSLWDALYIRDIAQNGFEKQGGLS